MTFGSKGCSEDVAFQTAKRGVLCALETAVVERAAPEEQYQKMPNDHWRPKVFSIAEVADAAKVDRSFADPFRRRLPRNEGADGIALAAQLSGSCPVPGQEHLDLMGSKKNIHPCGRKVLVKKHKD